MLAGWGAALAPLARDRCPVTRVTWQEWAHPVGVGTHRQFLAGSRPDPRAPPRQPPTTTSCSTRSAPIDDRPRCAASRSPSICVESAPGAGAINVAAALEVLAGEVDLLAARLSTAGLVVSPPLSPVELATAIRVRSDPTREHAAGAPIARRGRRAGCGRVGTDGRRMRLVPRPSRRVGASHLPDRRRGRCFPSPADWLAPLLTGGGQTRTLTVVMEPVPIGHAARAANRQLTSLETDRDEKQRKGFRPTARERRRIADVETPGRRTRCRASGVPSRRPASRSPPPTLDELDDACAQVEQDAAQSMLDIRPLAARQGEGWVASLPLGRSVRRGVWT